MRDNLEELKLRTQAVRQALVDRGVEHFAQGELDELDRTLHIFWEQALKDEARVQASDHVRDWAIAILISEDVTRPPNEVLTPEELLVLKERARQRLVEQGVKVAAPKPPPERVVTDHKLRGRRVSRHVVTRKGLGSLNLKGATVDEEL